MSSGKARLAILLVVLFFAGIFLTVDGFKNTRGVKNAVDFNEMEYDSVKKNLYVKGTTDVVMDYYCEETKTTNGVKTGTSRWYLIPYSNDNVQYHYIAVKVSDKMIDDYEKVLEDTIAFDEGKVDKLSYELKVQGKIRECTGKVKKYFDEYVAEVEKETNEDWSDNFAPYYIQMVSTNGARTSLIIGIVLSVVCGAILVIWFIKSRSEKAQYAGAVGKMSENATVSAQTPSETDELDKILAEADEKLRKNDDNPFHY